jgi:subtilisin family serine protease
VSASVSVRVGIADSGVNPRDVQVGPVEGGIGIRFRDGEIVLEPDWTDAIGHGTAVAATVRGLAPFAELHSIRVFHRSLEAHVEALLGAIEWAVEKRLDFLNLSLGCAHAGRRTEFLDACARAEEAGMVIVSAAGMLPGSIPGVVAVASDRALGDSEIRFDGSVYHAAPWALPRGELPRERNFHGTSFAVARVTGVAAGLFERLDRRNPEALRRDLARLASTR